MHAKHDRVSATTAREVVRERMLPDPVAETMGRAGHAMSVRQALLWGPYCWLAVADKLDVLCNHASSVDYVHQSLHATVTFDPHALCVGTVSDGGPAMDGLAMDGLQRRLLRMVVKTPCMP
eukprot:366569-Chlamydomonas_euryale.AAC.32